MKLKIVISSAFFCGLVLTSCGPKKDKAGVAEEVDVVLDEVSDKVETVITEVVPEEKAPEVPEVSLEELAAKTGFAQYVSPDVEGYFSIIDGDDLVERVLGSKLAEMISEENGGRANFDEILGKPEAQMIRAALGEEFIFSVGESAGQQGALLSEIGALSNKGQMKMAVELIAMKLSNQPPDRMARMASNFGGLLGDPKQLIDIVEKAVMPPLMLGIKVSDAEMRGNISNMIAGGIGQALQTEMPFFTELALEKSGVKLRGFTVLGEPLAGLIESEGESAAGIFGGEIEIKRLAKAIAGKNLHVATGVYGNYVLVFVGGRMEDFKLAESTESSFLAEKDASFLKQHADKDVRLITYVEEDSLRILAGKSQMLAPMLAGIKEGLENVEVFGDTRDVQTLLGHAISTEGQLFKMGSYTTSGTVGFIEDGFKIESYGGSSRPYLAFGKPHRFADLGESDDVVLFANSTSDPEFSGKLMDYLNSLGEAAYLMSKQASALDINEPDFLEYKQAFGLFDQLAASEMGEIWSALSTDFSEGIGDESALVIDLKGTLPKVPEVPAKVIESGRLPRLALVYPVTDREKIGKTWTRINGSITKMLTKAAEAKLFEFPMQEPIVSEKDGFSTYFFSIPTITKDANPNVTISDELFLASSSPLFNSELSGMIAKEAKTKRSGSYLKVNFTTLLDFATYWVKLAQENPDEFFKGRESDKNEFLANVPKIERVIAAMGELQDLTAHTREVDGKVRSTIHFRTK